MREERRDPKQEEHFVTFFDHRFILQGLALHESLRRWGPSAHLWVLCLDAEVQYQLEILELPGLSIIPLDDMETRDLLEVKPQRSWAEYIYTLTPFTFEYVFATDPSIHRVTYVDADLFFFRDPSEWLRQHCEPKKSVLITEHGFAPEYRDIAASSGRFCVQFLPVRWSTCGRTVIRRWQKQCLASTSTAIDSRDSVFGDQGYLEDWPDLFPDCVQVVSGNTEMQAPWNADHYHRAVESSYEPLFYHFHSLRFLPMKWVQLCAGYPIGNAMHLYKKYITSLRRQQSLLLDRGLAAPPPSPFEALWFLRLFWRLITGRITLRRSL